MADFDLIIRGGQTILPGEEGGISKSDIGITDGKIAAVEKSLKGQTGETEIKATKFTVAPAFLDAHVHFNEPGRDDWEGIQTGSRALALGGGSWYADMPLNSEPPCLTAAELEKKRDLALQKSSTDFSLWGGLTPDNLDEIDGLADAGCIGLKAFMCDSGIDSFPTITEDALKKGMEKAAERGLVVAVHAELQDALDRHAEEFPPVDRSARSFLDSRPTDPEVRAALLATGLAEETGAKLHIVHASCPEVLAIVDLAKDDGADVTVETCPHYLLFHEAHVLGETGAAFKCCPPLRREWTRDTMWSAIGDGEIDTVGSDHSPAPPSMKESANDDFFEIWGGIAGCQHGFPALLGEANMRAFGMQKISDLASSNVANRFGIASRKGTIEVGKDADLVLLSFLEKGDPITADDLVYQHPYSAYIGHASPCTVHATYCRGHELTGKKGLPEGFQPQFVRPE